MFPVECSDIYNKISEITQSLMHENRWSGNKTEFTTWWNGKVLFLKRKIIGPRDGAQWIGTSIMHCWQRTSLTRRSSRDGAQWIGTSIMHCWQRTSLTRRPSRDGAQWIGTGIMHCWQRTPVMVMIPSLTQVAAPLAGSHAAREVDVLPWDLGVV